MAQQAHEGFVETLAVSISNKGMLGGAIAGLYGWLIQVNWIGLGGFLIALIGLSANIYFQHRRDKREQAEREERRWREEREHQLRMAALKERCEV